MTPAEARAQMEATAQSRKGRAAPGRSVEERMIPGPAGNIRLRLYWPKRAVRFRRSSIFMAAAMSSAVSTTHDLIARNLCAGAAALAASVDYRMGPEYRFPAAVEDSFAALEWVHRNAESLRRRPGPGRGAWRQRRSQPRRVAALLARDARGPKLRLQSLVYPVADYNLVGDSYERYARDCGLLTKAAMVWFRDH